MESVSQHTPLMLVAALVPKLQVWRKSVQDETEGIFGQWRNPQEKQWNLLHQSLAKRSFPDLSSVLRKEMDYYNVCHSLFSCIPKTGTCEMRSSSSGGRCVLADIKSCSPILSDSSSLRAAPQSMTSAEVTLLLL